MRERTAVAAGGYNPFVARMVEKAGFDVVYVSGGALSNLMALPDEGLVPFSDVLRMTRQIARATTAPVVVDADTGFGGPVGVARAVRAFEAAGVAAIQIEDQDPRFKRCGHLDGKHLISKERMVAKVRAAVDARRDDSFLIIARTDARSVEGLGAAIERAQAYQAAGADMIFPEAPQSREEFIAFRKALKAPLLANMTEFGKSPWLTDSEFEELGYNLVIHPVTTFRIAAQAIEEGLAEMLATGNQASLIARGRVMSRDAADAYLLDV
jgi:methylisocitrate lyase